jgi:hypothetical protein
MVVLKMERPMDNWNDDRLDELSRHMDEGFKEMREGFVRVDQRFERFEQRFERLFYLIITISLGFAASDVLPKILG